jgi:hypothetical protein
LWLALSVSRPEGDSGVGSGTPFYPFRVGLPETRPDTWIPALAGDPAPLSFRGETPEARDAYVNRENQIDVDAHQNDDLQQLLAAFRSARLETISMARGLDASQLRTPLAIEGHDLSLVQLFPSAHLHARLHVEHIQRALAGDSP